MAQQDDMPRKRRVSFTASMVALIVVFLLTADLALGYVLIRQSATTIRSLVNQRMLDISNTAADMLDGDELEALTADDVDTEAYQQALGTLDYFRRNTDLSYIYGIRQVGEDSFVFTVDPEPVDPGTFGEPVVTTPALKAAAAGTAAVDDEAYEDAWGKFYSSYSPVFDSKGEVAGVVAVDFSATWYDEQVSRHMRTAIIIGAFSLVAGAAVVVVITSRMRRRFYRLHQELSDMAEDLDALTKEVMSPAHSPEAPAATDVTAAAEKPRLRPSHDIDALSDKIDELQEELRTHIKIVREQAYTDSLTGVGNKAVYAEKTGHLAEAIVAGEARFSVAAFDVNGLKHANDSYGHEEGDRLIIDTARVICQAFGEQRTCRIGGDEFFVIAEDATAEDMAASFAVFDEELEKLNCREDRLVLPLAVSKGSATFDPTIDSDYQAVFKRADTEMYRDKAAYYQTHEDRRRDYHPPTDEQHSES